MVQRDLSGLGFRQLCMAIVIVVFCYQVGRAQSPTRSTILAFASTVSSFSESFIPAQTRGRPRPETVSLRGIAAVQIGTPTGKFRSDALILDLPPPLDDTTPDRYCVRISSSDGRYNAVNSFDRTSTDRSRGTIDFRSKYNDVLSSLYDMRDILVLVSRSQSCEPGNVRSIIPLLPYGDANAGSLFVYVNAPGDRSRIMAFDRKGARIAEGVCELVDAVLLYTERCGIVLDAAQKARVARLDVVNIGPTKNTQSVPIWMPQSP